MGADSSDGAGSFITLLRRDVISPPPIWRTSAYRTSGSHDPPTSTVWSTGKWRDTARLPPPLPVCLPMSFNERADKQRGGGPEPGPFIITSSMITLFHPLYRINITRHGLDDLQSHLISLDTAFTGRGWGGGGLSLYRGNCWMGEEG